MHRKTPKLDAWLSQNAKDVSFLYHPDLYSLDLRATVPMAERLYEILAASETFPQYLTVDARMFQQFFGDRQPAQRLQILGQFLYDLKAWQSTTVLQQFQRFPFHFGWEGRLRDLADAYRTRKAEPR